MRTVVLLSAAASVAFATSVLDLGRSIQAYDGEVTALLDAARRAPNSTTGNSEIDTIGKALDSAGLQGAAVSRAIDSRSINSNLAIGVIRTLQTTQTNLKAACIHVGRNEQYLTNVEYATFRGASRHTSLFGKELAAKVPVAQQPSLLGLFDDLHRSFNNCKSALNADGQVE